MKYPRDISWRSSKHTYVPMYKSCWWKMLSQLAYHSVSGRDKKSPVCRTLKFLGGEEQTAGRPNMCPSKSLEKATK